MGAKFDKLAYWVRHFLFLNRFTICLLPDNSGIEGAAQTPRGPGSSRRKTLWWLWWFAAGTWHIAVRVVFSTQARCAVLLSDCGDRGWWRWRLLLAEWSSMFRVYLRQQNFFSWGLSYQLFWFVSPLVLGRRFWSVKHRVKYVGSEQSHIWLVKAKSIYLKEGSTLPENVKIIIKLTDWAAHYPARDLYSQ